MMIFAGGVYVSENTSQAASVEFVGHRHTNYARSRLQALCLKIPWIFRHRKEPPPAGGGSFRIFHSPFSRPAVKNPLDFSLRLYFPGKTRYNRKKTRGGGPMETLQVALGRRSYPIYIGGGLLEQAEELLRPLGVGRWAIVCDDTVAALYGAPLARRTGWPLVTFPAGEGSKSLEEYDRLCRRLVQLGLTRSDGIVALGGGVTGDLAGFAAATLLRGVALVQAPTTLLAQVDSAVGGKTGLDLPEGKNLLGCFYQPRMVLADTVCLATLPRRQLACGMAEVIKYGCIADEELLTRLEQQEPDWPRIIRRCLACKAALVAQDERDEGPRRLLNFGHTFGHAMEALGGGRYTHGECVAAGMMEMLRWQTAHGSDQTAMLARLGTLLERYDLPRRLDLPGTAWRQYLLRDKKRSGGEMTIAVLERPGHGVLWSVTPEELLEETRWM